ncbi:imidazoleglycerol-phosphate dehydratase HisB [uncultured Parolsenella sp.]|uniref:imidazoleglycerol-phosphate dehydratase HisB n=1 Tax=uncultured Parolsenella sp. TaxID=2083008 RepID=UPI0025DFCD59|nr:imidazoleglycerol-phosphate dehydratase HisB [uncultured Parolsenella sp.]
MTRCATVPRKTGETDITITIDLDGSGKVDVETGVGFFDHMLCAFGRHGLFDLTVRAAGDTQVDDHHTVEDVGIVLGQAVREALGDKAGITRFADVAIAMDESLVQVAIDVSGRGQAYVDLPVPTQKVGTFDTELAEEFFIAFARDAGLTLHVRELAGSNSHHIIEAAFKAFGRALRFACELDPHVIGVPSTKGSL